VQGKTIWVTDAGSALGAGLVDGLVGAGNFVIVSGGDASTLRTMVARSRGAVAALPIDEARRWGAAPLVPSLAEITDRLDIVVCGGPASEVRGPMPAGVLDAAACALLIEVEYMHPVRLIDAALPLLRRGRNPYLVCISSLPARMRGVPCGAADAASAALECAARALSGKGPGAIDVSIARVGRPDVQPQAAAQAILAGLAKRKALIQVSPARRGYNAGTRGWQLRWSQWGRSGGVAG
jgi:NAD(P)-dependent dehydrogenase (short-subunit alcohol dehydrogenase family)